MQELIKPNEFKIKKTERVGKHGKDYIVDIHQEEEIAERLNDYIRKGV